MQAERNLILKSEISLGQRRQEVTGIRKSLTEGNRLFDEMRISSCCTPEHSLRPSPLSK